MGQSWMVADNEQPVNVSYSGGDFMPFKNDNDNSVTVTKITSANSNSAASATGSGGAVVGINVMQDGNNTFTGSHILSTVLWWTTKRNGRSRSSRSSLSLQK